MRGQNRVILTSTIITSKAGKLFHRMNDDQKQQLTDNIAGNRLFR